MVRFNKEKESYLRSFPFYKRSLKIYLHTYITILFLDMIVILIDNLFNQIFISLKNMKIHNLRHNCINTKIKINNVANGDYLSLKHTRDISHNL